MQCDSLELRGPRFRRPVTGRAGLIVTAGNVRVVLTRVSSQPKLFFDQFLELMDSFPPFLFPMLRLQERLQNANGGVKFWKAKKKLFQNARGRLQMNRI